MGAKNCQETPRQKMISMMYLVLTALLALNVSREVINAFVLVDIGLTETIQNFRAKNDGIYDAFVKAELENPQKVKEWKLKAEQVKSETQKLIKTIHALKVEIIKSADGEEAPAIKGDSIFSDLIEGKDNLDYAARIMIGSDGNGKGKDLKNSINTFRDILISMVHPTHSGIIETLKKNLDTSNPKKSGTEQKFNTELLTWERLNFESIPLIAVITNLSKIQTDILNAESDITNYLYKQIDASSFKFNKLEAVVKANSSVVFKDGKYKAEVFLAAYDTTQRPVIYIGQVDSVKKDGIWDYKMVGKADTIPIVNGKGIFERTASSTNSSIKWGGLIYFKTPDGGENHYKFKSEYQVIDRGLVVAPNKMNVFYIGVDNPVDVSVPGIPSENLKVNISNSGVITRNQDGTYTVKVRTPDLKGANTFISVSAKVDNKEIDFGKKYFRVKTVPDPVAKVNNMKGGRIAANLLAAQIGITAEIEQFDFLMPFTITEFNVSANIRNNMVDKASKSFRFTPEQLDLFRSLRKGDKVYIEDIKAKGPDGTIRSLPNLLFRIQ